MTLVIIIIGLFVRLVWSALVALAGAIPVMIMFDVLHDNYGFHALNYSSAYGIAFSVLLLIGLGSLELNAKE